MQAFAQTIGRAKNGGFTCSAHRYRPPFTHTGTDLFGPFYVRNGRKECKRYGVIFTCLACRAIHIEVAFTLETDSFINALRRFIARRGSVRHLYCDNGTNLVGAQRELYKAARVDDEHGEQIRRRMFEAEIEWHFNPPGASHMGGIYERQIRSVRTVLKSMMIEFGGRLCDETLMTLMCEAEYIVNSRPLTIVSDSSDDLAPLSPNQILNLKSNGGLAPRGCFDSDACLYARKRWKQVQHLTQVFWARWKREFLKALQSRQKWTRARRNLEVGDVVLLKEGEERGQWPLARVTGQEIGSDGLVRSVSLRTQNGSFRRPVVKCVLLLPIEEQ